MRTLILFNIILLGVLSWFLLMPGPAIEPAPGNSRASMSSSQQIDQLEARIGVLEQELSEEIAARINLEQRLAQNRSLIAATETPDTTLEDSGQSFSASVQDGTEAIDNSVTLEQNLIAAGMPLDTIQAMKSTFDQNQLEMLQLRDRAIREGWSDSAEFREQMSALSNPYQELREQFGDEAYDQYLFASGMPNRVQIREVYSGSAADNAGLRPGDIFVSYASAPIYSMSALRQSTLEGSAGESVLLELVRDGDSFTASVPRGPLGISMSAVVVQPE